MHTDNLSSQRVEEELREEEEVERAVRLATIEKEFSRLQRAYGSLHREHTAVKAIFSLLNAGLDTDALMEEILDVLMGALDVEAGSIFLYRPESDVLYFAAARGPKAHLVKKFTLKPSEGIAGCCYTNNETLVISDVKSDERFKREIDQATGFDTRSILAVPISIDNVPVGLVEVLNKAGDDDAYLRDDIELVTCAAYMTGELLKNLRALQEAQEEGAK